MLRSNLRCQTCGAVFTVDLDKDNADCPKCGSCSTTATTVNSTKKLLK